MTPQTLEQSIDAANAAGALYHEDIRTTFALVSVDDIYIDRYQRPLDERWISKREGKLDRAKLQVVILSARPFERGEDPDEREGKPYAAVDGQHRIELVRRYEPDPALRFVKALIFHDLTIEQEAQLFADFQLERRKVSPYQRFNAELIAGNPRATEINRIVHEEGYALGDFDVYGQTLKAIRAIENIYDDAPERLRLVLQLVRDTWGALPGASNDRMLKAVWLFLQTTEDVSAERFVNRLGGSTPSSLVTRALNLREFKGTDDSIHKYLAEALKDQYRSNRKRT